MAWSIQSLACLLSSFWPLNSAFQSASRICAASASRALPRAASAFSVFVYVESPALLLASAAVDAASVSIENWPNEAMICL